MDFIQKMFSTVDFPPRWRCGNWEAFEGWLHIVSDGVICLAYIAIPTALFILVRKRRDIAFPAIVWLFIAFVLSCGIAHGFEAAIFWWPAYRVTGVLKAITAVVSVVTVVALVAALPEALKIPSLTREHKELTVSLEDANQRNESLSVTRRDLERRASELAVRERRMRDAVVAAKACAVVWDVDSGKVVWELGYLPLLRSLELTGFADDFSWEDLIGASAALVLNEKAREACETRSVLHLRFALRGYDGEWDVRLTVTPDERTPGQGRTMSGLFGLVPYDQSRKMEAMYAV